MMIRNSGCPCSCHGGPLGCCCCCCVEPSRAQDPVWQSPPPLCFSLPHPRSPTAYLLADKGQVGLGDLGHLFLDGLELLRVQACASIQLPELTWSNLDCAC